jgi:subtilisin family serine protease
MQSCAPRGLEAIARLYAIVAAVLTILALASPGAVRAAQPETDHEPAVSRLSERLADTRLRERVADAPLHERTDGQPESQAAERYDKERKDIPDNQADTADAADTAEGTDSLDLDDKGGALGAGPLEIAADREGHELRAREVVAIGEARDADRVAALGYAVIERRRLAGLGGLLIRVRVPGEASPDAVRAAVLAAAPTAAVDVNHIYRTAAGGAASDRPVAPWPARARRGGLVGVVDTGVDLKAPGLAPAILAARTFAPGPAASPAHGTNVAYLAARGGARVLAAAVFTRAPSGGEATSVDAMARAVDWLVARGATVINLSLEGPANAALAEVVRRAQARGCVVVAAAGNSGPAAPPAYPAAYPQVVAVTAVDATGGPYAYANRGAYIMFAARGVNVAVPSAGAGASASVSGTSYAAPVVAALLAGRLERQDGRAAAAAVESLTRQARHLGPPGRNAIFGYGLLGD